MNTTTDSAERLSPSACPPPNVLWLQYHGDSAELDNAQVDDGDVTWCRDHIFPNDVEYVCAREVRNLLSALDDCIALPANILLPMNALSEMLEANDSGQTPRTQDVADTTDSPERLSASVLFAVDWSFGHDDRWWRLRSLEMCMVVEVGVLIICCVVLVKLHGIIKNDRRHRNDGYGKPNQYSGKDANFVSDGISRLGILDSQRGKSFLSVKHVLLWLPITTQKLIMGICEKVANGLGKVCVNLGNGLLSMGSFFRRHGDGCCGSANKLLYDSLEN